MPSLNLRFDKYSRPIIRVEVKPSVLLHQQYQAHPPNFVPSCSVDFLIDTAANECVIEEDLLHGWNLMKHVPIIVNSTVVGYRYPLSLRLTEIGQTDSWYHKTWSVSTIYSGRFGGIVKGLIGMDLLRGGMIEYDGPHNTCVLSWV
jgi:hypothetical protein